MQAMRAVVKARRIWGSGLCVWCCIICVALSGRMLGEGSQVMTSAEGLRIEPGDEVVPTSRRSNALYVRLDIFMSCMYSIHTNFYAHAHGRERGAHTETSRGTTHN